MRPVIGITTSFSEEQSEPRHGGRISLPADYADAVRAAGGLPCLLPPLTAADAGLFDDLIAHLDGLLFTGGQDLDPRHYGQSPHPATRVMHARRDAFELAFFRHADTAGVPILAICLGFQVAHVARGGWLVQHVPDLAREPAVVHRSPDGADVFHSVRISAGARLAEIVGSTEIEVNSRHHQGVLPDGLGRGLQAVGFSPDGLVEASEDCAGRFLLAVQWHPENLTDRREHARLFEALIAAASGFTLPAAT